MLLHEKEKEQNVFLQDLGEGGGAAVTRWTLEREVPGSNPGLGYQNFKIWVWGGVVWHG